jgi:hypothetical protein
MTSHFGASPVSPPKMLTSKLGNIERLEEKSKENADGPHQPN